MSLWESLFSGSQTSTVAQEGISIEPDTPRMGEEVRVGYDGLLAQHGADQVYLHIGYGNGWGNVEDIPMKQSSDSWYCDFVPEYRKVNFCFYDSANNWDNNNGANWSLTIER